MTATPSSACGSPRLRIILTLIGATAFCVFSRTWQDIWHLIYDIPAALAVYSFVAQLVAERVAGSRDGRWTARLIALSLMSVVTVGRQFAHWPISGHVTTTVAVCIIQLGDLHLPRLLRMLYLVPLPIVVAIRLFVFDRGLGAPLVSALVAGVLIGVIPVMLRGYGLSRTGGC
jgi:hypothetical protein